MSYKHYGTDTGLGPWALGWGVYSDDNPQRQQMAQLTFNAAFDPRSVHGQCQYQVALSLHSSPRLASPLSLGLVTTINRKGFLFCHFPTNFECDS